MVNRLPSFPLFLKGTAVFWAIYHMFFVFNNVPLLCTLLKENSIHTTMQPNKRLLYFSGAYMFYLKRPLSLCLSLQRILGSVGWAVQEDPEYQSNTTTVLKSCSIVYAILIYYQALLTFLIIFDYVSCKFVVILSCVYLSTI